MVKYDDEVIDLAGFSVNGVGMARDGTAQTFDGTVEWADQAKGWVTVQLASGDCALATGVKQSRYELQIWVSDSTNTLATLDVLYFVDEAIGTKPTTDPV